ncbi:MAG: glycosyltransferase family 2 protein [Patescibacteria group bacterium]|jgi:GT2 family glycosyltransferase
MKLAVGFLTYNEATAKYLGDFLPSLERALDFLSPDDYRVYAFDNSDKGNLANIRRLKQSENIVYFCHGYNLGFSRAYNYLVREAIKNKAEYFLVINPDTLIEPEAIKKLVAALDSDGSLGSAAPKLLRWDFSNQIKTSLVDSLGLVLKSGLRFSDLKQGIKDDGKNISYPILGPSGAAGLFRLSAMEKIAESRREGGSQYYDERFFMYKEDCDLAYRLFLAGYSSKLIPEAIIYHDRTATVSGQGMKGFWRDRQSKSRKIRAWSFRNQHLIFLKHWKKQNFVNKIIICLEISTLLIFSLILEQFLLKEYFCALKLYRGLTNIKYCDKLGEK